MARPHQRDDMLSRQHVGGTQDLREAALQHQLGAVADLGGRVCRPDGLCMAKVRVASVGKITLKPASLAWREVVSQHCSVRMPLTMTSPIS